MRYKDQNYRSDGQLKLLRICKFYRKFNKTFIPNSFENSAHAQLAGVKRKGSVNACAANRVTAKAKNFVPVAEALVVSGKNLPWRRSQKEIARYLRLGVHANRGAWFLLSFS